MSSIRRYVLPIAAGASLVLGLAVALPTAVSAKSTNPSIKISPKAVANAGGTVTVTGKNFGDATTGVNLVMCLVGATGQNNCDVGTATPVTVSTTGTFSQTFVVPGGSNVTGGYSDEAGDMCGTTAANQKSCGIGAGNPTETEVATPVAIKIKPPKK